MKDNNKKFSPLSMETKLIIQNQLNTMLDEVIDSVYIHQCEQDTPNSPEFWSDNEKMLSVANEYIIAVLNGEEG